MVITLNFKTGTYFLETKFMEIKLLHYYLHIGDKPVLRQLDEEIYCDSLEEVDKWRNKIAEKEEVDKVFLSYSIITKPDQLHEQIQ